MFESHDAKSFADTSAEDITWNDLSAPAPINGKKEMVKYFNMVTKAIPDLKMNCTTWAVDDFIVEECAMSGTNKGPFVAPGMTMPATNKPLNLHGVDVIQLKDGKAVSGIELRQRHGDGHAARSHEGATRQGRRGQGRHEGRPEVRQVEALE